MPSISGIFGRFRKPTAVTTAFERRRSGPAGPSTSISHMDDPSSHVSERTSVSKTISSRRSNVSATQSKYCWFSAQSQNGLEYG